MMSEKTKARYWQQLIQTFKEAREYKDFMQLMACAVAYQGGVAVAITLAAIYAEQVIGFEPQETMVLIFVLNIAALVGSLVLGYAQDRIGHKLALSLTLWGWVITCVVAAMSTSKEMFWWAAILAGVCMGSSQSTGRAMAALFIPSQRLAEFFGLWAFAIRLASILGPMGYGLITWVTDGNQRLAIAATTGLFFVGWLLLLPVNVQRGHLLATQKSNGESVA
jgi:UMF1 family MFS transporter